MQFSDWYWLGWLLAIFLIYELVAAFFTPRKRDTFSEWVWNVFAVQRKDAPYHRLRRTILTGFMAVLTAHFVLATSAVPVALFGAGVAWAIWYHYRVERRA